MSAEHKSKANVGIGLVALTGIIGLLVLVILPDLHKAEC